MEQRSIFKLQDLISSLDIVFVEETPVTNAAEAPAPVASVIRDATALKKDNPDSASVSACNTCKKSFLNTEEQQAHYKSQWHRFNLKLRVAGLKRISEEEFQKIESSTSMEDAKVEDTDDKDKVTTKELAEADDDESPVSNTSNIRVAEIDSEPSSLVRTGSAKVSFYAKNKTNSKPTKVSVWKSVLLPKSKQADSHSYLTALREAPCKDQWTVLMCTGGYFAGAVFRNKEVLQHKRIARYTVRRKQGGAQASKDSSDPSHAPKSAGAYIRRQNEKKLREEIAQLLKDWKSLIDHSHLIFLFAPSYNRWSFLYEGSPITKDDPRLRKVPFATRRPSFLELKRVQETLSTVDIISVDELPSLNKPVAADTTEIPFLLHQSADSVGSVSSANMASDLGQESEVEEVDLLLDAVRRRDVAELTRLMDEGYEQPIPLKRDAEWHTPLSLAYELKYSDIVEFLLSERLEDVDLDFRIPHLNFQTVLHMAARKADIGMVESLLLCGADPSVKELHELTPFDVCEDKETRLLFRRFAGENPGLWDYDAAHIPAPLSREAEEERKRKEAEKRKKKKQAQKEKKASQKKEEEEARLREVEAELKKQQQLEERRYVEEASRERERRLAGMSDREKRAAAAEARLAGTAARRCDNCGTLLTMVPFERLSYKYCSTKCVMDHKKRMDFEVPNKK